MAQPYVLPNRKAFADSIVRIFLKYKNKVIDPLDLADNEEDLCKKQGDMSRNSRELLEHQKIVRDYLLNETPYRGLLLYHGLGSGKTCSAIAVAESLLSTRKVVVFLPAALQANFRGEIRKCGDPIYRFEQYWESKLARSPEDRELAKNMGISESYLDKNTNRFFVTVPDRPPNYAALDKPLQDAIGKQIEDVLEQRFTFINYDGLSKNNIAKYVPEDGSNPYDDTTVIIDEAHNFIGAVLKESQLKTPLYNLIYHAKRCKVILLSGTPVINRPNEIAFAMNLVRGPIERLTIPTKSAVSWDEALMTAFFRSVKDIDTIEYNSVKRTIMLTRNPPNFESVYNEKNERIAVRYNKEFDQNPDIKEWVSTWRGKFVEQFGGVELDSPEKFIVEELQCLPTEFEEFMKTFIDGLNVKNANLFMRRIQGLVSYFRTADERLLPKRIDEDKTLTKIPMSEEQFLRYLTVRWDEVQQESRRGTKVSLNNDEVPTSYRANSRMVCNYAVPPEINRIIAESGKDEKEVASEVITKMKASPEKFFSEVALATMSPKMLQMLKDVKQNVGDPKNLNNQFVYSCYRVVEGIGIFAAILESNGFQRYKIIKNTAGQWVEDPALKPGVPAFGTYTGADSEEERELIRKIFNGPDITGRYESGFPQSLKDSIGPKKLCILMGTRSAAEGITLKNVRNVYITESHWNPALIDQAIGRAIRLCSHASLPMEDRTVSVRVYLTVFNDEQSKTQEGPNIVPIRRNDTVLKRYEGGEPKETFMTSDEYLWETSYEKGRIVKSIAHILKQAAVDCEIHRKIHSKEKPIIQCMRFDTTATSEDLAFGPDVRKEERDTLYLRNLQRRSRRLQKVKVKDIVIVLDPDTNQVYDYASFEDSKRLIQLGIRTAPGEIRFFSSVVV